MKDIILGGLLGFALNLGLKATDHMFKSQKLWRIFASDCNNAKQLIFEDNRSEIKELVARYNYHVSSGTFDNNLLTHVYNFISILNEYLQSSLTDEDDRKRIIYKKITCFSDAVYLNGYTSNTIKDTVNTLANRMQKSITFGAVLLIVNSTVIATISPHLFTNKPNAWYIIDILLLSTMSMIILIFLFINVVILPCNISCKIKPNSFPLSFLQLTSCFLTIISLILLLLFGSEVC